MVSGITKLATKLAPKAVEAIGVEGLFAAGLIAGGVEWGTNKIIGCAKKGFTKLVDDHRDTIEAKKAALLSAKKKDAIEVEAETVEEEEPEVTKEEKPKNTSNKKKNK